MNPIEFFHSGKKHRFIYGGCRGIISILMCIVMLPFASIASLLIETYRYQHTCEMIQELSELSGFSLMADYDSYLNNRFGLLAVSQESMTDGCYGVFSDYVEQNMTMLGASAVLTKAKAQGQSGTSFSETFLVEQQILDYCELNLTADVAADMMEGIVDKIKASVMGSDFSKILGNLDKAEAVISDISDILGSIEGICNSIDNLKNEIGTIPAKKDALINLMTEKMPKLIELVTEQTSILADIKQLEIKLSAEPDNETVRSEIEEKKNKIEGEGGLASSIKEITDEIGGLYEAYRADSKRIVGEVNSILSSITSVKDSFSSLRKTLKKDKGNTQEDTGDKGSEDGSTSKTEDADDELSIYDTIYNQIEKIVVDNIENSVEVKVNEIKKSLNNLIDYDKDKFIEDLKQNITVDFDQNTYMVKFTFDLKGLTENNQVRSALNSILDSMTVKKTDILKLLKAIVDSIKELFSLDLIDKDLDTVIPSEYRNGIGATSSFQNILDSIGGFKSCLSDLYTAVKDGKWKTVFNKTKQAISLAKGVINSITSAINTFMNNINTKFANGFQGLLRIILVTEYMRRNLPNRVNHENGTALTGYSYSSIPKGNNVYKGAELEYIFAGTDSEQNSQKCVVAYIFMIRLILDLPVVMRDGDVNTITNTISAIPFVGSIISMIIRVIYCVAEPLCDTMLLVNSKASDPVKLFVKRNCYLTASGIKNLVADIKRTKYCTEARLAVWNSIQNQLGSGSSGAAVVSNTGFSYEDYLWIGILIFCSEKEVVQRFSVLLWTEAEAFYQAKGSSFSIKNAYSCVQLDIDAKTNSLLSVQGLEDMYTVHMTNYRGY